MKKSVYLIFPLLLSCGGKGDAKSDDEVNSVDGKHAVETRLSIEHLGNQDVIKTHHKIWLKNSVIRDVVYRDTVPALGDTLINVEGDQSDTPRKVPKEYEFYITVQ